MKIGDLVRRYTSTRLGIIVDTARNSVGQQRHIKVRWDEEYGTFWTSPKVVEVVSEMPNKPLTGRAHCAIL
jgi:hypothetical protein